VGVTLPAAPVEVWAVLAVGVEEVASATLAQITITNTTKRSFFTRLSCYFSLLQYTAILTAYGDGFTELRFAPATRLRRQGQTFRDYVAA
jgi:hypothetical protein